MSETNRDGRRRFLKFTAGVAGCAFAPGVLRSSGGAGTARIGRTAESLRSEDLSYIGQGYIGQAGAGKDGGINIIGPKAGYSPQVGTLVSMLTWMQEAIGRSTEGMTQAELDYLLDAKANTIGALMLHLAATEVFYQANTFEGKDLSEEMKRKWGPAMDLGDAGRKTIKGHDRDYYLGILKETREKSLAEFAKRDDAWLMAVDKDWPWGRRIIIASGFMCASTFRIIAGRLCFCGSGCRGRRAGSEGEAGGRRQKAEQEACAGEAAQAV